jgi:hypothetical protein
VIVYGVTVSNWYGPTEVEGVFSTEAAAFEYAQRRSGEHYANTGSVTRWEVDRPGDKTWLMVYEGGTQRHRNERARQLRPRPLR